MGNGKKTLLLIRHAKSSWSDPALADFDRPLNKRGRNDAALMGKQLLRRGLFPDLFLSSSAKRAKKTARKIAKEICFAKKAVKYDSTLYHADVSGFLEVIKNVDQTVNTLFVVGHNFTITDLACELIDETIRHIPTAGIVGLRFPGTWQNLSAGKGELLFFDFPKKYKI